MENRQAHDEIQQEIFLNYSKGKNGLEKYPKRFCFIIHLLVNDNEHQRI